MIYLFIGLYLKLCGWQYLGMSQLLDDNHNFFDNFKNWIYYYSLHILFPACFALLFWGYEYLFQV